MTAMLWATFGMTLGAAVLHAALGLARPVGRTHLSFACIMACVAAFVYFEWQLYRTPTGAVAGAVARHQIIAAHGILAFILVFVCSYTQVRLPRWLISVYWVGLAVLFIANLRAPHGVWYAEEPEVVRATFRGEPYNSIVSPPLTALQYLHVVYVLGVFAFAFACALRMIRRGDRQRGAMLAIGLVVIVAGHLVDVVRDKIGGSWPYVAEFGLATWGLIMSIQLAIDFRVTQRSLRETLRRGEQHAAELARLIDATLLVRDKLNTPLQTLELGLAMRAPTRPEETQTLAELRKAVVELARLGRAVEHTTDHQPTALAGQGGAS
jgi:hypothetical protein